MRYSSLRPSNTLTLFPHHDDIKLPPLTSMLYPWICSCDPGIQKSLYNHDTTVLQPDMESNFTNLAALTVRFLCSTWIRELSRWSPEGMEGDG